MIILKWPWFFLCIFKNEKKLGIYSRESFNKSFSLWFLEGNLTNYLIKTKPCYFFFFFFCHNDSFFDGFKENFNLLEKKTSKQQQQNLAVSFSASLLLAQQNIAAVFYLCKTKIQPLREKICQPSRGLCWKRDSHVLLLLE